MGSDLFMVPPKDNDNERKWGKGGMYEDLAIAATRLAKLRMAIELHLDSYRGHPKQLHCGVCQRNEKLTKVLQEDDELRDSNK